MAQFNFVGKIVPIKDSDKFKGYTEKVYDSGWMTQRLCFNLVAGDNRHLIEINAGRWKDDKKNGVVYTYTKAEEGKKSQPIQITWDKRNDPEEIAKVAGNRIFTIDTDTYNHRKELEENGEDAALEISKKKCKHFIAGTDFIEWAHKVVNSDKIKDMLFRVRGNINYSYSEKTGQYYVVYEVQKIHRVDDDVKPTSEVNMNFFFTEGAVDSDSYDETGKAIVSGYTTFYDSITKKNWFAPVSLVVRGDSKKIAIWEKVFNKFEDDEVRKINLVCQKIDGAQKSDIRLEDLDEDTQEHVKAGLISLNDAIKEAGGQMYGDRIRELRIEKLGRGSSKGSETTAYTVEDCKEKPHKEEEKVDIFSDDEEDI